MHGNRGAQTPPPPNESGRKNSEKFQDALVLLFPFILSLSLSHVRVGVGAGAV